MSTVLLAVGAGSLQPLSALAATPASAPHSAAADAPGTSTLVKTAQNVTHPGQSTAGHGDTVNWTVGYHSSASADPASATITDAIQGAGESQSFVPGSLSVPPGWTPSWSTDGTTFTSADPGAATTAVRATDPAATSDGTGVRASLLPPVQAAARSTGGDGFTPILYRTPSGDVEAWNIYHHTGPAVPLVVCNDLSSGQACAGGPWPRPLNTTPGPLGSGSTGNVYTPLTPQYVLDPGRPGVVYYPAVAAGAVGVGCLDMGARANCGFVPLLASNGTPSSANGLAGIVATGGKAYGVASTGQVLCMDIAARAACSGQPFARIVPPNHDVPGNTNALYQGSTVVIDGKVFASSAPQNGSTAGGPPALGCFDPATGDVCAGWTTPHPAGPSASAYTYNAFGTWDAAGHATGVCTTDTTAGTPATSCYALDGSPAAAPATGLDALSAGTLVFNPEVVSTDGDLRSYFAVWGGPNPGDTLCYSWTHAAPCAGFPALAGHPGVNGGATRDYGYSYDATTGCLIGLGDAGVLFSMDPASGRSPCVHSGATVELRPSAFYCDGAGGHVQGYTQARLEDIDLAHADLTASTVTVSDTGGDVVARPALPANGIIDLSGISAADHPSLTVTVQLVLTDTSDFTTDNHPALTASFQGDDPQVCLRTMVAADCATTQVTDTATGADSTGALTSNAVSVDVEPGASCRPHVTVDKQICTVASPHACGPGGAGPWAKTSPVGLLGLLGTAYWRITVTNDGPVDAVGVTVNDHTTPQCHIAAGTFTLAAGASAQVWCSSFLLALPLTNTASATYGAALDPPGTPPVTSAPSSAIACSLLCILAKGDRAA
ncbi:DUF11 domain-containing protein [Actinacidiphila rubida]|uniref:DUF11 domain-containing protein n=1 Tax=Actinacidiphila rubida TaxID=310780 RepID=UPI001FED095B|nr:DUF11 domain-containing protein [Actinacidiphila rubida]